MAYQRLVEQRGIWLIKWVKTGEPIFTNWVYRLIPLLTENKTILDASCFTKLCIIVRHHYTQHSDLIQLLIAYSIKTNEQELYIAIAKPQNEARSDIQLPEEGRSAAISSYCYAS